MTGPDVQGGPPTEQNQNLPLEGKPDEQSAETVFKPTASYVERLKQVAKNVFEHNGVKFIRGGGRPRKDGAPNKKDVPLNAAPTNLPLGVATPPPDPNTNLDPALVKRCCKALLKAIQGFFDTHLSRKARQVGYAPNEIKQLCLDSSITEEEANSFSELAEICLRKYGVGTAYAPEIGLGCIVIGVGIRYSTAIRELNVALQKKRQADVEAMKKHAN